jgi:uncharacterized protein (DUF2141 family)
MKPFSPLFLSGLIACALWLPAPAATAAAVEVRVSGVANAKGKVSVAVCDKERFLKQCAYSASAPVQAGETTVVVKNIPPGTWAVLAYLDENDNGELDRNFIGMPKEPYGFSRDARSKFGPPRFEDAVIELGDAPTITNIILR